jgi:hypothetical protein
LGKDYGLCPYVPLGEVKGGGGVEAYVVKKPGSGQDFFLMLGKNRPKRGVSDGSRGVGPTPDPPLTSCMGSVRKC